MENKANIGILSLGCPRNLVDSESILGRLNLRGYPVVDIDKAEVAIVNTCSFIEDAKRESIDAILDLIELKKQGRLKKIIVYGCLPQRYKKELRKELPEVDAFIGRVSLNHQPKRFSITPRHYAYLKVCEGCVNNCSFCIIPKIKGRFASLSRASILGKVCLFNREKVSEINIIGQDITGYGLDLGRKDGLPEILKGIIKKAKDIGWLRLLYLYPKRISNELLALIRDEEKICKYIDLPIQHINNRILRQMCRQTSKKEIYSLIDKIRKTLPGAALRTSIIAGFPSETDAEFRELLRFIEEVKFERLGAFIYSREEGTPAYSFKKQIPQKIKEERFNLIMSTQQRISAEKNKEFLGRTIDVLIDEEAKDACPALPSEDKLRRKGGVYLGRSQHDAPEVDGVVYVKAKRKLNVGEFVKVKITDTLEYDLVGEAVA